jgi:hypothetical protein
VRAPGDSINKLYGSALVDQLGEGERTPVDKPNAAMRFGFAHVLRLWRAVNSITFDRKVEPLRQHRRRLRLFDGSRSTWRRFSLGAIRSGIRWRHSLRARLVALAPVSHRRLLIWEHRSDRDHGDAADRAKRLKTSRFHVQRSRAGTEGCATR